MELFLQLISGIAWTIVYIECIKTGIKQKTYCIPLFALGLNIAWKAIYTIDGFRDFGVQTVVNLVWVLCDCLIVYTYFKYGKKSFPENSKKYFIPFSILAFVSCTAMQLAFYLHLDWYSAARYSAFAQNIAMSILFLIMLFRRNSSEGQTMAIAVAKWLGTLAPTILMGIYREFNIYVLIMGILCTVWDLPYIFLLHKKIKEEKAAN